MEQVYPGDLIDIGGGYNHIYPQWWHDIKNQMENKHQLRKCEFLERIPDSGDRCPGVATHTDKYYCIFGTDLKPSWYCTCFERIGEYKFHCNSYDLIIEDTIEEIEEEEENNNEETNRTEQEINIDEAIQDAILYTSINESNTLDEENNNNNNNEVIIHPGDCIDEDCGYRHIEPQWWHDIKDTMTENSHLLRKCDFLDRIPNTNDNCPGVASHSDHYYCIFGTSQKPLWYCTCYEHVGDYKFHCNADDIRTVDDILKEEVASDVATYAIDHIDNAIQHSVAYERDEDEQQDSSPIALIPPDKVNLISTTSGGESSMDDTTTTLKNSNTNNDGYPNNFLHPHHHSKWSTGFSFGVGFSIGILAAAMMITVYLRILHRRARHRFINEEVCDPTLGTTTYQTPIPPPPPPPPITSPRGRMMSSSPRSPPLRLPIPPTGVVMQNLLWDNQGYNEEDEWEVDREQREQLRQLTKNSFSVV